VYGRTVSYPYSFRTNDRLLAQKQPGKALPYFLRLKQARVFELIRDHNLFMAIQDQIVLLVDLDDTESAAVQLLVDHMHSIPVSVDAKRDFSDDRLHEWSGN
jgi:hypothetical protein